MYIIAIMLFMSKSRFFTMMLVRGALVRGALVGVALVGLVAWEFAWAESSAQAWLNERTQHEEDLARIEAERGPFSEALYEPLMALARLQLSHGHYEEATAALLRAQNITHRNSGVYSAEQLEAVAMLTEAAMAQEDWSAANQQQKFTFFTRLKQSPSDSPEAVSAHFDLASWYLRTGQPKRARRLLRKALPLASSTEQRFALAILEQKAQRLQGQCCKLKHLGTVLAEEAGKRADPDALAALYLTLADSLLVGRKPELAQTYYAEAATVSPAAAQAPPRPISIRQPLYPRRQLEEQRARTSTSAPIGSRHLTRTSRDLNFRLQQGLSEDQRESPWFILNGDLAHLGFRVTDLHAANPHEGGAQTLAGHPIIFSEALLERLLPRSLRTREARAQLLVELAFTVTADGRPTAIRVVESNAPSRLNRLLMTALSMAYFRPRLVDGTPSQEDNVRLVQTFFAAEASL